MNRNSGVGLRMICFILIGLLIVISSCKEEEEPIDISVSSITIKGDFIEDGGTTQLTVVVNPEEATNKTVEWTVSNESVATINDTGLLTAVSNGILTVKASATDGSGVTATKSINVSGVTGPQILVESISIQAKNITDGKSQQLSVVVLPSNAGNKVVKWSVSDEEIAKISETGLLTPIADGAVTIAALATDGSGITDSKQITIDGASTVLVESITISGSNVTDGSTQQLALDVLPSNAENKTVEWSVSDQAIASVNATGLLTPLQNGTVTITATSQDGSGVAGELTLSLSGVEGTVVTTSAQLLSAVSDAQAGDVILVSEGTYPFSSKINFSRNGQSSNMITLISHPSNTSRPVFDFSSMPENSSNRGAQLSGDFWHIKGIDFYGAGDNGMFISGDNNLVEFCFFYENADTGLQIGNGATQNTVLNCDSYFNADSSIENADGFACKLDAGDGNKFIGCRAWQNLDDGWDGYLRGTDNITTYYEDCWAVKNGYLKSGSVGGGDGNGFKTGGSDDKLLKHNAEYRNCIAAGNVVDGFDHNSNRGNVTFYNVSAHDNGRNFSFGTGNIAASLTIKNSLSLEGNSSDQFNASSTDITNNSWLNGLNASSEDFSSLNIDLLLSPRKADGSLPDINYLHLVQGSDLIDAGVDVGLPFNGTAPDLGAFEFE